MPSYQIINSEPFSADQEDGSMVLGKKLTVNTMTDSGESELSTFFCRDNEDEAKVCSRRAHAFQDALVAEAAKDEVVVKPNPVVVALPKNQL